MKPLFLCLALAALPAYGEQRAADAAPIVVYTQFQQEPPAAVLDALQDEVESIMAPMGLHFEWRSFATSDRGAVAAQLAVITFKGRCDIASLSPRSVSPGPLGWTHVSDGVILPFSNVDCDGMRGFVGKQLLSVAEDDREEAYGRALGRVSAHELYHVFANTVRHGSDGVGKPVYTVQDLLSADFHFERREAAALKTSQAHPALETTPPPVLQ